MEDKMQKKAKRTHSPVIKSEDERENSPKILKMDPLPPPPAFLHQFIKKSPEMNNRDIKRSASPDDALGKFIAIYLM
jgi:hypothetical protein